MWTPYDWLNKFYSFCMPAIVCIDNRRGLRIEARRRTPPNKSKLALYKPLVYFYGQQLYISNKTEHFSDNNGCGVCVGVNISRHLKEELA